MKANQPWTKKNRDKALAKEFPAFTIDDRPYVGMHMYFCPKPGDCLQSDIYEWWIAYDIGADEFVVCQREAGTWYLTTLRPRPASPPYMGFSAPYPSEALIERMKRSPAFRAYRSC